MDLDFSAELIRAIASGFSIVSGVIGFFVGGNYRKLIARWRSYNIDLINHDVFLHFSDTRNNLPSMVGTNEDFKKVTVVLYNKILIKYLTLLCNKAISVDLHKKSNKDISVWIRSQFYILENVIEKELIDKKVPVLVIKKYLEISHYFLQPILDMILKTIDDKQIPKKQRIKNIFDLVSFFILKILPKMINAQVINANGEFNKFHYMLKTDDSKKW